MHPNAKLLVPSTLLATALQTGGTMAGSKAQTPESQQQGYFDVLFMVLTLQVMDASQLLNLGHN